MRGPRKRGSDEDWIGGRRGIRRGSRNTPGGRGFSSENLPRDGPTTPPPGVGEIVDSSQRNDLAPVHLSPSHSGGYSSPSDAPSRSEGDWRHRSVALTPPRLARDRDSSATPLHPKSRSDGEWRVRSASSTPPLSDRDRNSSGTPPYHTSSDAKSGNSSGTPPYPSRSDATSWRNESGSKSPSSSGTPPYPTRSDVASWRSESDEATLTGWPDRRPLPEFNVAFMTAGILGRAPLATRKKQYSADICDSAEVDPEAEREAAKDEEMQLVMESMWQDEMVKFLNRYKHPSHECEFYIAQLAMLKLLGKMDVTIEFEHLMSWNRNLAYIICNGQQCDEQWLDEALHRFLSEHGEKSEEATISFKNMPKRLKTGRDIFSAPSDLVIAVTLFKGRERVLTSSYRFAQIIDAIFSSLFARLSCDISWCGQLTINDIEFTEVDGVLRAIIKREPQIHQDATGEDQVLDIHSLWPMIELVATWRGLLPLYFLELKKDLTCATVEEITKPWFREYITYHPSLMPSMGRRNFEIGLYQIVGSLNLDETLVLKDVLALEPMLTDWRKSVDDDKYLKVSFRHENPWASQDQKEWRKVTTSGGTVADNAYQDRAALEIVPRQQKEMAEHQMSVTTKGDDRILEGEKSEAKDVFKGCRYENSIRGIIEFKRHFHIHPNITTDDIDESEVFVSRILWTSLAKVLRELLKNHKMTGQFESIWSAYKTSKSDPRRLTTTTKSSNSDEARWRT